MARGPITTLFLDIGGVILTNGWDRTARRHCTDALGLDWDEIYRLAFDLTQCRPDEALFIDDRELNIECAEDVGLRGLQFESLDQLRSELQDRGVSIS